MRQLLREIVAAYPEERRPETLVRAIEEHTHDDVLSILGMCLAVASKEVLSPEAHTSVKVHADMNKLSPICLWAEQCPDPALAWQAIRAKRALKRLMYPNAPACQWE